MPAVPSKPHAYVAPTDCGDALVEHALVLHHGKGENHPARVVLEAKLATCPQPVSPSPARCFAIAEERTERSRDWGPRHPAMIDLALAATLCKDVPPPPPPPPVACEEARRRRDALIAAGKGANHPLLVEAESAVADCVR